MTKKKSTKKTSDVKPKDEPAEEKVNDDELPSLDHLDLEDALKKAMDVPWTKTDDIDK